MCVSQGEARHLGSEMLTYPPASWQALIFLLFVECPWHWPSRQHQRWLAWSLPSGMHALVYFPLLNIDRTCGLFQPSRIQWGGWGATSIILFQDMAEGIGCQPCDSIILYKTLSCESHSCPPVALKEASRHVVKEPMWQGMQSYNHKEFSGASNLSELGCRLLPGEPSDEKAAQPAPW